MDAGSTAEEATLLREPVQMYIKLSINVGLRGVANAEAKMRVHNKDLETRFEEGLRK